MIFSLTQSHAIEAVHRKYLEAGADIIETITLFLRLPLQWQITTWKIWCMNSI